MTVRAVTTGVGSHGLVILDSEKGNTMDEEEPEQLYRVCTFGLNHHGDMTENLTFMEGMRLIQNRYEQTNIEVQFASIELQA